jgi:hypothetical protein
VKEVVYIVKCRGCGTFNPSGCVLLQKSVFERSKFSIKDVVRVKTQPTRTNFRRSDILLKFQLKSFPMEEILNLINDLGAEVTSGIITSDEAAQLLAYGNVVEDS